MEFSLVALEEWADFLGMLKTLLQGFEEDAVGFSRKAKRKE